MESTNNNVIVDRLVLSTDCRTPILLNEPAHDDGGASDAVEPVLEAAGASRGISLVCFRLDYPDDEPRMFRALDQAQYNGDWLLVLLARVSNSSEEDSPLSYVFAQEFLRKVARRQYSTMPKDSSSSMELCRLFIKVPWQEGAVPLPAIFQQICVSAKFHRHSSSNQELLGSLSPQEESSPTQATASAEETPAEGKLGKLFFRRLERVKGVEPSGTSTANRRPKTADVAGREIPSATQQMMVAGDCPSNTTTMIPTTEDPQKKFEVLAAEAVQQLYEKLLRAQSTSSQGASRLLRQTQLLSSAETETHVGKEDGLTWCNASDISIGPVLFRSTSSGATCVVRQGHWRGITVAIHHYSSMDYEQLLPSLQLQFSTRHPFIVSPWSVAKGEDNQGFYCVMPLAPVGPSALSFRTLVSLSTPETDFRYSQDITQANQQNLHPGWEEAALGLMRSVASMGSCIGSALLSLHKEGILHRDVNIQNVFDFGNGIYKLVLTPRARHLSLGSDVATSDGVALRWSSPEALSRASYAASDDVYGLGILMWEALTGAHHAPLAQIVSVDDAVRAIVEGAKPPRPAHCDAAFWDHIVAPCFAAAPYRPALRHLIESLTEYLQSEVFVIPPGSQPTDE